MMFISLTLAEKAIGTEMTLKPQMNGVLVVLATVLILELLVAVVTFEQSVGGMVVDVLGVGVVISEPAIAGVAVFFVHGD